ncbi:hypothetical protein LguiA_033939 [Lonicera macranthoides]
MRDACNMKKVHSVPCNRVAGLYIGLRATEYGRLCAWFKKIALDRAGIYAFRDDERIERGEKINSELIKAMQGSRVSIVVYSENYARSTWCLDELTWIDECRFVYGQTPCNLIVCFLPHIKEGYSELETSDMYLTRKDIPDWFSHQSMGSSISFDIPPFHVRKKFLGMTLWIVYEGSGDGPVMTHSPEAIIMNRTNGVELRHTFPLSYGTHNPGCHSWVCHIPVIYLGYPIRGGEEMEVWFEINHPLEVKKCGIHLVYKQNIEEDDQGQSSGVDGNVNSDGAIVDNMRPKRACIAELVETSDELNKEDADPKRLRLELSTSKSQME